MGHEATNGDLEQQLNYAFVLQPDRQFVYEERRVPGPITGRDVLIRVVATGICGSDVHYWQHGCIGPYKVTNPIILGHESAGVVVACGDAVKELKVGDRVAMEPGISCSTCRDCRSGKYNLCNSMRFAATPPYDGTLATFYRLPEECCFRLPENVSFEEGALMEPLSVAVHCCKLAAVSPGASVLVFGAGPIGLLVCAVARAFGASTVGVADIVASRLDFARHYAATETHLLGPKTDTKTQLSLPGGFDAVIEATGVEACVESGVKALKRGGVFVQAGLGSPSIQFPVGMICDKELNFKGSFRYGPGDYELAIELVRKRAVSVKDLITHRFSFDEAAEAFKTVANRDGIKSIIRGHSTGSVTAD
ncbi:xylitol dehydrogenase [Macrophomina phaseolina]|uniref:Xylitol dehydrogenase n=1 Tax=Macrophomina phaseolina TaxID=35725 RepID=A0ABQ8FYL8_9PEZI|nr:xylitol dehydrogenase [Macrophomina phaseolina]